MSRSAAQKCSQPSFVAVVKEKTVYPIILPVSRFALAVVFFLTKIEKESQTVVHTSRDVHVLDN